MLVHRIALGFMFVHVVYLSAYPVFEEDKKTSSDTLAAFSEDETTAAESSEPLEPWEVNQDLINRQGVEGFCLVLSQCVYISVLAKYPLICRLSTFISNRKRKSHTDHVEAAERLASNVTAVKKNMI